MKNKVSIIIPVYNAEKYISRCIESVLEQSYKNIEIILVNDGSKDNSLNILKKFDSISEKIVVIDKKNSGVSETRNKGIETASGDFILFLDADDYLDKNYVENLLKTIKKNNADLIITGFKEIKEDKIECKSLYKNKINDSDSIDITYPKKIHDYVSTIEFNPCWKMMISSKLIGEYQIKFDNSIKYGEDMLFSFKCYINSKKTIYYLNYGYNYYINNCSAMNKKNLTSLKKYYSDNIKTFDIISDSIILNKEDYNALIYKTLQVFKGITGKLIEYCDNYNEFKKEYKNIRKYYDKLFKKFSYKFKYKIEGLLILILKHKLNYLYFLLRKGK